MYFEKKTILALLLNGPVYVKHAAASNNGRKFQATFGERIKMEDDMRIDRHCAQ